MGEKQNSNWFVKEWMHSFPIIFTMTVLLFSLLGSFIVHYAPETHDISTIYSLRGGLSYNTILQITGLSLILAAIKAIIFSDMFLISLRFFMRLLIFLLAITSVIIIFVILFKWFPIDSLTAWLNFAVSIIIWYVIISCISLFMFKMKDKKYNQLLDNYKKRHGG